MIELIDRLNQAMPDGYRVDCPLGKGGQGAVFLGYRGGDQEVALKLFDSPDVERLKREINLLQSVSCDHVVRLLDFQVLQFDGRSIPMAVYEYIDGGDLRQHLQTGGPLGETELLALGDQIGTAIEALWEKRIVHRDVKPENIVQASSGRFVLVDVGFAQHLNLSTITHPAGQPGTNGYRSPEQCGRRQRLTIHSDVFSLGVTIFEVAAGVHPWNGNQALMEKVSPTVSLHERCPSLSLRLIGLVNQMLRRRPSERPANPGTRFRQLRGK